MLNCYNFTKTGIYWSPCLKIQLLPTARPIFYFILKVESDTSWDQWIKCFDSGELRMVAEGLQNKYQLRRKVGVNRPNTLRWLS